jgi:hypothetical protein
VEEWYNRLMRRFLRYPLVFFAITFLMAAGSCALGPRLHTQKADLDEVTGRYTLILYGCNYFDDLETVAILGKEGGRFVFEPYAPEFNYRIIKDLPAKEALEKAEQFVDCNSSFKSSLLAGILDPGGRILGYELRPLYFTFTYGTDDVLNTFYWIRDGKINVSIRLTPSLQRHLDNGGRERDGD